MRAGMIVAAGFVLAVACAGAASAQDAGKGTDWPQFLGPERNGTSPEKGLLREWPEGGPRLLWRVPMGRGFGTPTVSKGQVFLLGTAKGGRSVLCLDAATGKTIWEFTYETQKADKDAAKKMTPGWGYCPRASVTALDGVVYSIDEIGELYCIDRRTGRPVWFRDMDTDFKPSHNDWKGWCASPLVVDGKVILPVSPQYSPPPKHERKIAALDAKTGKTLWEFGDTIESKEMLSAGGGLFATPQLADFAGAQCVVWPGAQHLYAVNVADGKKVWEFKEKGRQTWQITPQVWGGEILMGSLLSVDRAKAPFATRVAWEPPFTQGATTYAIPVRSGDYVYAFLYMKNACIGPGGSLNTARLSCIDLKTGAEVWTKENLAHGVSVMAADGLLFARWGNGLYLLDAGPEGYREKGKVEFKGVQHSGWVMPTLARGRLYVRSEDAVYCFDVAK